MGRGQWVRLPGIQTLEEEGQWVYPEILRVGGGYCINQKFWEMDMVSVVSFINNSLGGGGGGGLREGDGGPILLRYHFSKFLSISSRIFTLFVSFLRFCHF